MQKFCMIHDYHSNEIGQLVHIGCCEYHNPTGRVGMYKDVTNEISIQTCVGSSASEPVISL